MARRTLTKRERTLVAAAIAVFFGIIILPVGSILAREYRATQVALADAEDGLKHARELRALILEQRKGADLIAQRVREGSGDFNLFNFARTIVDQQNLTDRAKLQQRIGPEKLNLIAIDLTGVSLKELIALMSALQDGKHLISVELISSIEASRDKKGLNCSLSLVAPQPGAATGANR
jgi:hypothetical protein